MSGVTLDLTAYARDRATAYTASRHAFCKVWPSPASLLYSPRAHLFGVQVSDRATIPAEAAQADKQLGHPLQLAGLFVDWNTQAATFTDRWNSASYGNAVPVITWQPAPFGGKLSTLADIIAGTYDAYIASVAQAAAAYGKTVILRWGHEMNGTWYPWGRVSGNTPAMYVQAWQHVDALFTEAGAGNVLSHWCPNVGTGAADFTPYYPGDDFVDLVGLDGYNTVNQSHAWTWPENVFGPSLTTLKAITGKPILIGEAGCAEYGTPSGWPSSGTGTKADWITRFTALLSEAGAAGFLWSEWSPDTLSSSPAALSAMSTALTTTWD